MDSSDDNSCRGPNVENIIYSPSLYSPPAQQRKTKRSPCHYDSFRLNEYFYTFYHNSDISNLICFMYCMLFFLISYTLIYSPVANNFFIIRLKKTVCMDRAVRPAKRKILPHTRTNDEESLCKSSLTHHQQAQQNKTARSVYKQAWAEYCLQVT